ncbi:helicase-exonuclease AddAB subunit AddA [Brevibacillus sp. B_LB10_24]|uniref:helicase-exonuclease AddAB subunit AddA n=1 Tax=Brevibacillus sp. B_LB10_24 TaxID=3380645 RepID=UPI0038B983E1
MAMKAAKPEHWTDEQWQAITERGDHLLVAAAAGSGKTSVLVERIIRRVSDPEEEVGVDRLLVVTFTNAAAAEMRQRIGEALRKALEANPASPHLRRQLTLLQRATITTLHSFCLGLLRQYYYLVDVDPDFRIADELEIELLRQDVLEAKLEEWYQDDAEFLALADAMMDGRDDTGLVNLLLQLHNFSRSHPDPEAWLRQSAEMFELKEGASLTDHLWTKDLLEGLSLEVKVIQGLLEKAVVLAGSANGPGSYLPLLEQERDAVQSAVLACEAGWEPLRRALDAIAFGRLPAAKEADDALKKQVQSLRNKAKEKVGALQEEYFSATDEDYLRDLYRLAPLMGTLARAVIQFDAAFTAEKQARGLVDFSDLEHLALQILREADETGGYRPSSVARQLQDQFAEVLVDEYQDINLTQETILQLVSRDPADGIAGNRFMVGDVKQSIYRFRQAEPRLFLEKYVSYRTGSESERKGAGRRIDLAANFRSRTVVVDAVNYLFRQIMTPRVGEISYDKSAELIGRARYPDADSEALDTEVHLIDRHLPDGNDDGSEPLGGNGADEASGGGVSAAADEVLEAEQVGTAQLEARLIAERIRMWMEPGAGSAPLLVFDKSSGGMRPLAYRDIVILLRANAGWAQPMMEELQAAGIPVYAEQNGGYFAATEVEVMLSLLRIIDNPQQDIPLAAVLRSPIVGLTEQHLAELRIAYPGIPFHQAVQLCVREGRDEGELDRRLRDFFQRVEDWRTAARRGSLADLLARIYRETGYLEFVASLDNGQQRQANLRALYDRARQYEATSFRGLFRFLRFVDRLQQKGRDMGEARTIGENEDVVRVMTIHKSKGLEFPVVFVAGLGKQFNTMDEKKHFLLHKDLGFGPKVSDSELRLRYPCLAYQAVRQQLHREMLAEEMRVLYVALTRAREKLILVASEKNLAKSIAAWCDQAGSGDALADEDLIQAKSSLDWVGRALVRHPAGAVLRDKCQEQGGELCLTTVPDDSRWSFFFYQADQFAAKKAETNLDRQVWERIVSLQSVGERPEDPFWREQLERQLTWSYPYLLAAQTAAKWSVSELKRMTEDVSESEQLRLSTEEGPARKWAQINKKPRFLTEQTIKTFSRAEIGTIVHTVMQQLDLKQPLDEAGVQHQLRDLVDREYLTREQAAQVNCQQIASFFASPLGLRLKAAARVHRELPFTMTVPLDQIMSDAIAETGEQVIVQGVIDCLAEEPDGSLIMVDYKTDAMIGSDRAASLVQLTNRYRKQLQLYTQAIEQIWQRRVDKSYLYFFSAGEAVLIGEGE